MKRIYTIGYGDKDFEQFLQILNRASVERIVDVRRFPKSKWSEYTKENIKSKLDSEGIDYVHLEELGGYRDQGYEGYMNSEDFGEGLEKLIRLSEEKRTAIMCLESYPSGCHRRFITERLRCEGWKIIHFVGKKGEPMMEKRLT